MSESLVDKDMFVIGGETAEDGSRPVGGTYFHVSQDKDSLEESYNVSMRGDINDTDYVEYRKNVDEDDGFVTYDVDAFSAGREYIMTGELDEDEVREIFDGELSFIADEILSGDDSGRINDCQYILAQNMDNDVLGAAKRIANGGPSAYLLTDGEFIYLPDHMQISSVPGMTVSKFVGLGNIRLKHNAIEIIKTPNERQINALYRWARTCDNTVHVDIAEERGGSYPRVIKSFSSEPNHVVNDLLRYFNILDECYDIIKENETQKLPSSLRIMLLDYSDEIWNAAIRNTHLREGRGDTYVMFNGETINLIFTLSDEFFRGQTKYAVEMANEMLDDVEAEDKFTVEAVSSLDVPSNGEVFNLDRNQYAERAVSLHESCQLLKKYFTRSRNITVNEEVVADGSADHNPYAETWKIERADLKDFLSKYGKLMTSRENGKTYKVYYDKVMSELIGHNYCVCIQYDQLEMKPTSSVVYLRALDKFTDRIFQAQFDDRGRDNMRGTSDDVNYTYPRY
jgi:hypothetical protein